MISYWIKSLQNHCNLLVIDSTLTYSITTSFGVNGHTWTYGSFLTLSSSFFKMHPRMWDDSWFLYETLSKKIREIYCNPANKGTMRGSWLDGILYMGLKSAPETPHNKAILCIISNNINHAVCCSNLLINYREPGSGSGSEIRISGWIRIRNPDPETSK